MANKSALQAVVGIIKRDSKLLIAERPPGKPYSGYWEFPGGKIEAHETSQQAITRELKEELGIDVLAAKFLFMHAHTYPDKEVCLDLWLIELFSQEPTSLEKQTLRWVNYAEISTFKLLEGNWGLIDKLKKYLN